jgi:diguanylate cyclase (GGDEF)-like protein
MTVSRLLALPWLIFACALGLTWLVWDHERQNETKEMRSQFDFALRDTVSGIEQRVSNYEQLLRGVQGLLSTTDLSDRNAVRNYVETIQQDANFSGIEVIGIAELVPFTHKQAHIAGMRQRGFSDYEIFPKGEREVYAAVVQREPYLGRVRKAPFGLDALADPQRRAAMERARDSGMPAITGKVKLAVDETGEPFPGFIMYLPVFAPGQAHGTVEQRRANLVGWVFASFRMHGLMASIYGKQVPGIAMAIYDGVTFSDETLLYAWPDKAAAQAPDVVGGLAADEYMVPAGRNWTVRLRVRPEFENRNGLGSATGIAVAGVFLSLSLAVMVWTMVTARARALRIAAQMTQELRLMAQQDTLTSLPNRALFNDRLTNQLAWAKRNEGQFAMIFLDLDGFKAINDNYGHGAGDAVLIEVAQRLRAAVRTSDTVGRLGGDEFVVLMPELSERTGAVALAEKIRMAVRAPIWFDAVELHVSCSLGIAIYPDDGTDEATLVRNADQAMYRAKAHGRDSSVLAGNA